MNCERYNDNARREVIPYIPSSAHSLLDVGCARGGFAGALAEARPDVEIDGLEPDDAAAAVAEPLLRSLFRGAFPEWMPEGHRYDCVTFLDSLEHMVDPWSALRQAKTLLSPAGCVVASIPNVRHISVLRQLLLNGEWRYEDQGLLDRTHLRFFTRRSMIRLFEEADYRIELITPVNSSVGSKVHRMARFSATAKDLSCEQYVIRARAGGHTWAS